MSKVQFLKKAHSIQVAICVAFLLLVPALYFSTVSDDIFDEPREFLIVLIGGMSVFLIESRRVAQGHALLSGGNGAWTRKFLLTFIAWAGLCAALAVNSTVAWAYFLTIASFALIGVSIVGWLEESSLRRSAVLSALAMLVSVQVIIAFAQIGRLPLLEWAKSTPAIMVGGQVVPGGFGPYELLMGLGISGASGQAIGSLGNVNYLSELLCLTLPVLLGWAVASTRRPVRWGVGLLALAGLGILIGNGTRGALLGLLVVAPIAAVSIWGKQAINPMHHWKIPRRRLLIGLGLAVGLGLFAITGERVAQKLHAIGQGDRAIQARLVNWRSDIGLVASRPITGVGVGNYKVVNQDKLRADNPTGIADVVSEGRFLRAHNEPLQALIEFGIVGFALLGALLVSWWRAVRHNAEVPPALRFGILWGVGSLLIAACFGFPLHVPVTAIALVLVTAAGLAGTKVAAKPERLLSGWRWVYATVAIVLFAGVLFTAVQKVYLPQFLAHQYLFAARALHVNGREPQASIVYGLLDRTARYRGVYRIEYIRSLVETGRYDEAMHLLDTSSQEGLGFEAGYWRARALWGLGRVAEARTAYEEVTLYFSPNHRFGAAAVKDLETIKRGGKLARTNG